MNESNILEWAKKKVPFAISVFKQEYHNDIITHRKERLHLKFNTLRRYTCEYVRL